jgi:hypothetical protein
MSILTRPAASPESASVERQGRDPYPTPYPTAVRKREALQRPLSEEKPVSQAGSGQRYHYSATFEFDFTPQLTVTGELVAAEPHLAAKLAVLALKRAYPRRQPRSLVVVLEWRVS